MEVSFMLFTESELQTQINPFSILDNAVYLTEEEAMVRPQTVSIMENSRLQAYVIDFNGVRQLAESFGLDYLDAAVAVAESDGIDIADACIAIDESDLIEDPELANLGAVVVRPLSELDEEFQFCLEAIDAYIDTDDETYLDAILEETILDEGRILRRIKKNIAKNKALGKIPVDPLIQTTSSMPHLSVDEISQKVLGLTKAHKAKARAEKVGDEKITALKRIRGASERLENWLNRKHGNETSSQQFHNDQDSWKEWMAKKKAKLTGGTPSNNGGSSGGSGPSIGSKISSAVSTLTGNSKGSSGSGSGGSSSGGSKLGSLVGSLTGGGSGGSSGSSGSGSGGSGSGGSKLGSLVGSLTGSGSKGSSSGSGSGSGSGGSGSSKIGSMVSILTGSGSKGSSSGGSNGNGSSSGGGIGSKLGSLLGGGSKGSSSSGGGNSGGGSGGGGGLAAVVGGGSSSSSGMSLGKKAAIGAGVATAIGSSILTYRQYQNKPKSVIAKRIAALRQTYSKFMSQAQKAPNDGIKNKLKHVAAKILSVIDKLMAFLQRKAG